MPESARSRRKWQVFQTFLGSQLADPEDDFVKLGGRRIHDGALTKAVLEQLRPAIQTSPDAVIRDRICDKPNVAFRPGAPVSEVPALVTPVTAAAGDIVTTDEEKMAFMIVRAISAKLIPVDRVTLRDSKNYCSVFVDDNNRKPVCRFYCNAKSVRHIGLFDAEKNEERLQIEGLNDIYKFTKRIEDTAKAYPQPYPTGARRIKGRCSPLPQRDHWPDSVPGRENNACGFKGISHRHDCRCGNLSLVD